MVGKLSQSARRNSLNRFGPPPKVETTRTVHLSPTRDSTSLTARQSSATCRVLGAKFVPSCAVLSVIYLASVIICNHTNRGNHDRTQEEQTQDRRHHQHHPRHPFRP